MQKLIDYAALGRTSQGRDWAMKALHPSHPSIRIRGIPDDDNGSTLFLEYKVRYYVTVPVSEGLTFNTWDARMTSQCNPIAPICIQLLATSTTGVDYSGAQYTLYNRAAMGTLADSAVSGVNDWFTRCAKWRPCYQSVTCQLDAPATASQGTWLAANVPTLASVGALTELGHMGSTVCCYLPPSYQPDAAAMRPQPGYAHGVMAPGAETGGCYLIQNLEPVASNWVGVTSKCQLSVVEPLDALPPADFPYPYRNGYDENGDAIIGLFGPAQGQEFAVGELAFPNNNKWISHAIFTGMSAEATLVLDLVQGWEVVVTPGSSFAQFANTSPPHDPQALEAYHEIRRHLMDAYPAAYNDWDKLWGVIKRIASVALPVVGLFGPIGAGLAIAGRAAVDVVDSVTKSKKNKKGKSRELVKVESTMTTRPVRVTRGS